MDALAQYSGKRVLVTGANSFIGQHLCHALLAHHAEVCGLYRQEKPKDLKLKWQQVDIGNQAHVEQVFTDFEPQYVFHMAGHVNGSREIDALQSTLYNNLLGSINLLTAAHKFTLTSPATLQTVVMAGTQEASRKLDEKTPSSAYAASKMATNVYTNMFHLLYKLPVTTARIFMVYGPGNQNIQRIIPYAINCALSNTTIQLANAKRSIDWIYIEDVVQALLLMGVNESTNGKTIDIGSGQLTTIKEIVATIVKLSRSNAIVEHKQSAQRPYETEFVADAIDTERILNWRAKTPLHIGLQNTIEAFKQRNDKLAKQHKEFNND